MGKHGGEKCHTPLYSCSASIASEFSQDVGNLRTDLEIREFAKQSWAFQRYTKIKYNSREILSHKIISQ